MILHEFVADHREEVLLAAAGLIRSLRPGTPAMDSARDENLPTFPAAVLAALRRREALPSDPVPPPREMGPRREHDHWKDYDIDEVVHEYGSLCTTIIKVADRHRQLISPEQHQALN